MAGPHSLLRASSSMVLTNPPVKTFVLAVFALMAVCLLGMLRRRAACSPAVSWSPPANSHSSNAGGGEKCSSKPYGIVQMSRAARRKVWAYSSKLNISTGFSMPADMHQWQEMVRASTFMQGLSPTTSCLQTRYGTLNDGGKTLCNVKHFLSGPRCLIYSFGVQRTCRAEQEIHEDFPHCEILMFDPTSAEFFKKASCCRQSNMKCIETALGGGQDVADNVGMAGDTLTELMKQHGHAGRTLNLLKMDIEGSEYNALEYYLNNAQTTKFPDVDLLLMEIHYLNRVRIRELVAKIIEWLEDIGLSIYYVERNPRYPMQLAEIALVNRSRLVLV